MTANKPTSDSITKKPEFVYVARNPCGCVMGVICVVPGDDVRWVATAVAKEIKAGRVIDRVAWQTYTSEVGREPTFMQCRHGQLRLV